MLAPTFCIPGPVSIAITSTPIEPADGSGLTSSLPPAPCLIRLVAVSVTTRPSRSATAASIDRRRASATASRRACAT
jgi:hypothetical protein